MRERACCRISVAVLVWCVVPIAASAQGWHDYTRDIGDGYFLFRNNSFDIGIALRNGVLNSVLISPDNFSGIGPLCGYCVTDSLIFVQTYGSRPRRLFDGDTYLEVDPSKQFYFIVEKGTSRVTGPLSRRAFEGHDSVKEHVPILWEAPKNPNMARAVLWDFAMLPMFLLLASVKYFYVTLPLLFGAALLVRTVVRRTS